FIAHYLHTAPVVKIGCANIIEQYHGAVQLIIYIVVSITHHTLLVSTALQIIIGYVDVWIVHKIGMDSHTQHTTFTLNDCIGFVIQGVCSTRHWFYPADIAILLG